MNNEERALTKEEVLQRRLDDVERGISSLSTENGVLRDEIAFWKRLALGELGVDSEKINQLVYQNRGGGVMAGTTLGRVRGY